jgi:hypothetical protein
VLDSSIEPTGLSSFTGVSTVSTTFSLNSFLDSDSGADGSAAVPFVSDELLTDAPSRSLEVALVVAFAFVVLVAFPVILRGVVAFEASVALEAVAF